MMSLESDKRKRKKKKKKEKKWRNFKPFSLFVFFFALVCEMTFIKTHSVESRCHCRTRKYTVSRHVPASFSLEVLQAGAVKGLRTMLTYFSSPLGQMGSLQSDKQYGNFIPWNIRWCREGCWNLCMTNDVQSTESKHRKVQTNVFLF